MGQDAEARGLVPACGPAGSLPVAWLCGIVPAPRPQGPTPPPPHTQPTLAPSEREGLGTEAGNIPRFRPGGGALAGAVSPAAPAGGALSQMLRLQEVLATHPTHPATLLPP